MSDQTWLDIRLEDGKPVLVGDAPPLIYIADELLKSRGEHLWVSGSNVLFRTDPPLRYVVRRRSEGYDGVWIAERVEGFES